MERPDSGASGGAGFSEDEELSASGPELQRGDAADPAGAAAIPDSDPERGSGSAVHPSGSGWSEPEDTASQES